MTGSQNLRFSLIESFQSFLCESLDFDKKLLHRQGLDGPMTSVTRSDSMYIFIINFLHQAICLKIFDYYFSCLQNRQTGILSCHFGHFSVLSNYMNHW